MDAHASVVLQLAYTVVIAWSELERMLSGRSGSTAMHFSAMRVVDAVTMVWQAIVERRARDVGRDRLLEIRT
jgi:hypothetical protein